MSSHTGNHIMMKTCKPPNNIHQE